MLKYIDNNKANITIAFKINIFYIYVNKV